MRKRIRLFKPSLNNKEIEEIKTSFSSSWIGYGPQVIKFEKMWCIFFKVKYSVGVNSCTAALHTALAVNNFKKNNNVLLHYEHCLLLTPQFTNINPNKSK